ncbi:TatD family hydrolase [bacterium]|nr:TatD family hydrolase [bacterium]
MNTSGLVDSHIHLTDFDPGTDIAALVGKAAAHGVSHMVCNATSESDWSAVLKAASDCPGVIPCFGLHPWFVMRRSGQWLIKLEELIKNNECGVGEMGLDRCADLLDKDAQEEAFRAQLDLAYRYCRPAMVHCVRSWGWMMDVLRSTHHLPKMVVHAFGGSVDMIKALADMGAYFSFSATVLNDNFKRARAALLSVPPDRLLVETDAPNMIPPEPFRLERITGTSGEMNHPANLAAITDGIASLLGESPDALREMLWNNACDFFGDLLDNDTAE